MDAPHLLPFLTLPTSALLPWLHVSLLSLLPFVAHSQYYSNDPSANNWTLSDFYQHYDSSDYRYRLAELYSFRNFVTCNNYSSSLTLLSDEDGLYGRSANLYSAHVSMQYTALFALYFVIPAKSVCLKGNNSSAAPSYYLSLVARNWYGNDLNRAKVLWTANIDKPVSENACLHLEEDSNLKLVEYQNNTSDVVWETNTTGRTVNASLAFTFEGNLVLFSNTTDPPYRPLWQSHQHPTNSLTVLQVLEKSSILTVNSSSPNLGTYTMAIQNGGLVLYVRIGQNINDHAEMNPYGSPYWAWPYSSVARLPRPPAANDKEFAALCWDSINQLSDHSSEISPEFCASISNSETMRIPDSGSNRPRNVTFATFLRLDQDGDLRAYTVQNTTLPGYNSDSNAFLWSRLYSAFNDTPCQLPLYCGFYGICDQQQKPGNYCTCDKEFESTDDSKGCKLKSNSSGVRQLWDHEQQYSNNTSTCTHKFSACSTNGSICNKLFLKISNVTYFSLEFHEPLQYNDAEQPDQFCIQKCDEDCNCTAVFWNQTTSSCFLIRGQVGTIQLQKEGNMVAFIKYINIRHPEKKSSLFPWMVAGTVLAATLVMTCIFLVYIYLQIRHLERSELEKERSLALLLDGSTTERFTWKQMHEYTCGFSDLLGGGGFGRVFRGSLPDGTAIAVKQLEEDGSSQGQGNKEFISEVSILSRIHHVHLVRLIGFCMEGRHRLLVYEHMENGSLDAWLFMSRVEHHVELHYSKKENNRPKDVISWMTRFQIALGTAKGLAYLHEECEDKVIHMDLKPQNILLGRNFLPKISDFGMSRITNREQTSVMTVMRGTPGYLAPEWLTDCAITEKCDVYSFGVVLLEMVSGRKVKDLRGVKQKLGMRSLRESVMLYLLDENLRHYGSTITTSDVKEEEVVRMVEVALLCVQADPSKRPTMSSVVLMLEGKEVVLQVGVMDDCDDEAEGKKQLMVMYPSSKNKTMRSMQRSSDSWKDTSGSNVRSSNNSGLIDKNYKNYFSIDHNTQKKKKTTSSFSESDHTSEWDQLLQK